LGQDDLDVGRDDVILCQSRVIEPAMQRAQLGHKRHKGLAALLWHTPVTIERGLGAAAERERNACLLGDGLDGKLGRLRGEVDDLACCVTEKVDRVFNSASRLAASS
jgi:hypothetical protein